MFDLVVGMRVGWFGWLVVGRRRVCIGRVMDLFGLVVEAAVGGSLIVSVGCCWEACRVVVRGDFRRMIVLVVL